MWEYWQSERWTWGGNSIIHWLLSSFSGFPLLRTPLGDSKQTYNISIYPGGFRKTKWKDRVERLNHTSIYLLEQIKEFFACCLELAWNHVTWDLTSYKVYYFSFREERSSGSLFYTTNYTSTSQFCLGKLDTVSWSLDREKWSQYFTFRVEI